MLLSVIVICYNQKDFIERTIKSVLRQKTDFDFEFIIGDDGSIDGTSDIIAQYAQKYPMIRYFQHEKNKGLIGNYSFCYRAAKGKYIATLDGDDYWIDDYKLSKQIQLLESDDNMGMVHTQYDTMYMYPKLFGKRYHKNTISQKLAEQNCSFQGIYSNSVICSSTVCYRKSIIDESLLIDRFDDGCFKMEDGPIFLQCSLNNSVGYINDSTTVYRVNVHSVSHSEDSNRRLRFLEETLEVRQFFAKLTKIDSKTEELLMQNRALSYAYHYYKESDYKAFLKVYKTIKLKPLLIRGMKFILCIKKYGLIKGDEFLKA
ncbi:glycosyltransferase family 2 protein [Carboxylicivirga sp. A043]|uniref:glycosyltransferase family 2 protein n=1 Tax=Carboxylicivirga litoralis TaxID=2816963 RepID=UPI0021CB57B2|nr:glycosyltransferase family 2 protein [Carboxylicivirga sp. A043]MCU4156569.1 glycosyltransferase family 2 protein [Carboxylicivirga sp. A043]